MGRLRVVFLSLWCGVAAAQDVAFSKCSEVRSAIAALPESGGTITLGAGTVVCEEPLVVDRDSVTIRGAGRATVLRLAGHVNRPVLVVGMVEPNPSRVVRGVVIRDLAIDGNAANQDRECSEEGCPAGSLRANGITIRRAEDVWVDNVAASNARSGGLVTELGCRRIRVTGLWSERNVFDGIALYETEDSTFSDLQLNSNQAAGISTDIRFQKNSFQNVFIRDTGKVGIFMRDSSGNTFAGLHIEGSKEHGVFLAQVDTDARTAAVRNVFQGLRVEGSGGAAVRINDESCVDNIVSGAILTNNAGGCVSEAVEGLLKTGTVVCR